MCPNKHGLKTQNYSFCVVPCVSFCTGHFVMVPLNMTYLHCLKHSLFEHLFNLYCHRNKLLMYKANKLHNNMESLGRVVSEIFFNFIWRCIFTRDLLMQPVKTIWTILVEDHTGTIPVQFKFPLSVQDKSSFEVFIIYFNLILWPPGRGQF